jgi:hypothetical protein
MTITIFWEMTPCGSYKNRRFGGDTDTERNSKLLYRRRLEWPPIQELTISLCICSHSFTLTMEAIRSSETSVLIRATWRHLPEDDNHQVLRASHKAITIIKAKKPHTITKSFITSAVIKKAQHLQVNLTNQSTSQI